MKLLLIAFAVAHSWYTGYHDPVTGYECCDDKKDCGVINPRFVEPLPGGNFNVRTGSKTRYFIPKTRVIESEDSQYPRRFRISAVSLRPVPRRADEKSGAPPG
ncbi:hypothetical protein [Mesorhizobium silamurunense]|uniref:hypothetical protein n=1 Tax=Mesorhizobium silamurunense TaxID=499528 RepID=UPI00177C97C3|nr:hypothetical protein [Mesorhizobium silamurunense]